MKVLARRRRRKVNGVHAMSNIAALCGVLTGTARRPRREELREPLGWLSVRGVRRVCECVW
jgi:hypothetical protein